MPYSKIVDIYTMSLNMSAVEFSGRQKKLLSVLCYPVGKINRKLQVSNNSICYIRVNVKNFINILKL